MTVMDQEERDSDEPSYLSLAALYKSTQSCFSHLDDSVSVDHTLNFYKVFLCDGQKLSCLPSGL